MIKSRMIKFYDRLLECSHKSALHKNTVLVPLHTMDNIDYEDEINYQQQQQNHYNYFKVKVAVEARYALCKHNSIRYYKAKNCWDAIRLAQYELDCNESIVSVVRIDDF